MTGRTVFLNLFRDMGFQETVVGDSGLERAKDQFQVVRCILQVNSLQTSVGACGRTPAIKDQSSQG